MLVGNAKHVKVLVLVNLELMVGFKEGFLFAWYHKERHETTFMCGHSLLYLFLKISRRFH